MERQTSTSESAPPKSHGVAGPKVHGTDWWQPPVGIPLCAAVPYVAPIVEDALSLTEQRVLRVITNVKLGARKHSGGDGTPRGYICDPGGYFRIAKNAGVCRKTAYNVVKSLIEKKALKVFDVQMRGAQRAKTLYFAPHYGDLLLRWREDETLFKTSRGAVVVRGRSKKIQTVEDAAEWQLDPERAPKRGCGRGRNPGEDRQQEMLNDAALGEAAQGDEVEDPAPRQRSGQRPAPSVLPGTNEELGMVLEAFESVARANLDDTIAVMKAARGGQSRYPLPVTAEHVCAALRSIAAAYEPNDKHPIPTPMWFITRVAGHIAHEMKAYRQDLLDSRPSHRWPAEDRVNWFQRAFTVIDSGHATPKELAHFQAAFADVRGYAPEDLETARESFNSTMRAAG